MTSKVGWPVGAALLVALLLGAVAGPPAAATGPRIGQTVASATVVRKPDGRIRLGAHGYPGRNRPTGDPFVGNNIYNATAARQNATVENFNELEGSWYSFDISIQNDGNRADAFKVKATGTGTRGWTVAYSHGSTNITQAVVAGTYATPSIAPGATYLIRARITVKDGSDVTRLLTIRSAAAPTKLDAVRFTYKQVACGC